MSQCAAEPQLAEPHALRPAYAAKRLQWCTSPTNNCLRARGIEAGVCGKCKSSKICTYCVFDDSCVTCKLAIPMCEQCIQSQLRCANCCEMVCKRCEGTVCICTLCDGVTCHECTRTGSRGKYCVKCVETNRRRLRRTEKMPLNTNRPPQP